MEKYSGSMNECEKCGSLMTREMKWTKSGAVIYVDTCIRCGHVKYPKAVEVPGSWAVTFGK